MSIDLLREVSNCIATGLLRFQSVFVSFFGENAKCLAVIDIFVGKKKTSKTAKSFCHLWVR